MGTKDFMPLFYHNPRDFSIEICKSVNLHKLAHTVMSDLHKYKSDNGIRQQKNHPQKPRR